MKYILITLASIVVIMIATGNMGGAKNATRNYVEIRQSAGSHSTESRPNPLAQMIAYNKNKKDKNDNSTILWLSILVLIGTGAYFLNQKRR
jgi:hypothetical protein